MRHFTNIIILLSSLTALANPSNSETSELSFRKLEEKFNNTLEKSEVEKEIDLIQNIKSSFNKEIEDGVFLAYAPKREELSPLEVAKFAEGSLSNFKNELVEFFNDKFKNGNFGTAISYKGYIITNYHVCRARDLILRDHNQKLIYAKVKAYDFQQDICVLSANPKVMTQYRDFSKIEQVIKPTTEIKSRNLASRNAVKVKPVQEVFNVSSMYGKFFVENLLKDSQYDMWAKKNAYSLESKNKQCVSGISGSAVTSSIKGFLGVAWGASGETEVKSLCYFMDKSEIDKVITTFEKAEKLANN